MRILNTTISECQKWPVFGELVSIKYRVIKSERSRPEGLGSCFRRIAVVSFQDSWPKLSWVRDTGIHRALCHQPAWRHCHCRRHLHSLVNEFSAVFWSLWSPFQPKSVVSCVSTERRAGVIPVCWGDFHQDSRSSSSTTTNSSSCSTTTDLRTDHPSTRRQCWWTTLLSGVFRWMR